MNVLFLPLHDYETVYNFKHDQLFHAIKDAIVYGKLSSGYKLPSTRSLAAQYSLSRGTICLVYEMLYAQGYVEARAGSGTYVSFHKQPQANEELATSQPLPLSDWGKQLQQTTQKQHNDNSKQYKHSFALNRVDIHSFPKQEWNKLYYEQVRLQYEYETYDANHADGHKELKQSIAGHLRHYRGISTTSEQIVIVNGSQMALTLIAQLIVNKGDAVAMENPHFQGARNAIQLAGGQIDYYPVDQNGILFDPDYNKDYKLIIVTPSRQFPTGAVLSMERRLALLKWASSKQAYIVEDDYDSEFQYIGRANEPLKSLDKHNRVIYIGTFSRTMMQSMRLGYIVLPPALLPWFKKAMEAYRKHPVSIIEQRALASFMSSGLYERHLRRMKRIYRKKAELLYHFVQEKLSYWLEVKPLHAGLHLFAYWKGSQAQYEHFHELCEQEDIFIPELSKCYNREELPTNKQNNVDQPIALAFGFSHFTHQQLIHILTRIQQLLLKV